MTIFDPLGVGLMMPINPLVQRSVRDALQDSILGKYSEHGFTLIKTDEETVALYFKDNIRESAVFTRPLIPQQVMAVCRRHLAQMAEPSEVTK